MGQTMITLGPAVAVAIVLYAVVGGVVAWLGRTGQAVEIPWAGVRAALQLVVLALVIGYVADEPWLVALFVAGMSATATWAAAGRVGRRAAPTPAVPRTPARVAWCALAVVAPPVVVVLALLAAGVVHPTGLSVIPVAGIYLGNAMSVVGLAGRRATEELTSRAGEVDARLALGFTDRTARWEVCRDAAAAALDPALDQTKTIGLVTIPGAFVGMVLGGASPWEAAVMQLFVSAGILAVGVVGLVTATQLAAAGRL